MFSPRSSKKVDTSYLDKRFKYTYLYRDGTFYQGDVPPPEPNLWDYPLTHLVLSYKMTGTRIVKAYYEFFKEKLT